LKGGEGHRVLCVNNSLYNPPSRTTKDKREVT
jgi:hypothetical protein